MTTKEPNNAGIYVFNFIINGLEKPVIVDDYIPVHHGLPYFASATQKGVLWPFLIEKAWAKLHGSYCASEYKSSTYASEAILGVPTKPYVHEKH